MQVTRASSSDPALAIGATEEVTQMEKDHLHSGTDPKFDQVAKNKIKKLHFLYVIFWISGGPQPKRREN